MASAVSLREDYSASELRRLAAATKNANQSRRLLSLAAVLDGMNRTQAARIGGMDRQTLRDWVHRFNAHGPDSLVDSWSKGPEPRLSAEQRAEIAQLVETGTGAALALPFADTDAMQLHLDEIARTVARGAHAVLLLDRAGWHTTGRLAVPRNMTLVFLPSRAPELNPVENLWQYLRANWLSNRVFDTYDEIIDAACDAWRKLIAQPATIASIGTREWVSTGQR